MRWHLKHAVHGDKAWAVQTEALNRSDGRPRFGQFLEPGLGKTSLTLNEFIDRGDVDLNIVLAPSSFLADWPLAPAEWGLGFLRTGMWPRDPIPLDWESGLYAIAHETLRGSYRARRALMELLQKRRCYLTFDEATGIKNPESELAKFMMTEAVKYAEVTRLLDGTPLTQSVEDYYPKLRCLGELNGVNRFSFRNRYARMGGFMGKQVKGINPEREHELGEILNRCSFRALRKDWRKDMPAQIFSEIHVEMTDEQRKHYKTMMEDFYALIGDDDVEINAAMVLTQRMKLQQISSCMLMQDGRAHWINDPKDNPKLRAINDKMDMEQGKSIIVYYFDPSGRMLIDQMQKRGMNPAWVTGKMAGKDIVEQKARFNDDPDCRVIITQQDQGSRGHTLIGQKGDDRCNKLFYYENSLSLMHRLQMNDRNYRGEQDQECNIYDMIASPVDQANVDILTGKKSQADGMDAIIKLVRERKWSNG